MIESLLPYAVLAAGLIACQGLFLSLKREVRRERAARERAIEELAAQIANHAAEAAEREADQPASVPVMIAAPLRPGFQLTRRTQALRLLRRGEDVGHVAAAIGVTRAEVELLVRVQQMGVSRPPAA